MMAVGGEVDSGEVTEIKQDSVTLKFAGRGLAVWRRATG